MCSCNDAAYKAARQAIIDASTKAKEAAENELNRVESSGEVITCMLEHASNVYNHLEQGFISDGKPYCEGGTFGTQYGGLSKQISEISKTKADLEENKESLLKVIEQCDTDIQNAQYEIDHMEPQPDCAACIAAAAAAAAAEAESKYPDYVSLGWFGD